MKAVIVGFGSIGQRHYKVLKALGKSVSIVSRRAINLPNCYVSIAEAFSSDDIDYVIIASKTNEHHEDLKTVVQVSGNIKILVEKPLFIHSTGEISVGDKTDKISVAYNLRFHPVIQRIKEYASNGEKISKVCVYNGSYLPSWRPNSNYFESYSAKRSEGGGVLRDLSHEIDYVLWLFGGWHCLTANGGASETLQIDSDDTYDILMSTARCSYINIHLSYLDRDPRRTITLNIGNRTIIGDLLKNTISVNGETEYLGTLERDYTYEAQHREILASRYKSICSFSQGVEILKTIEAIEEAKSHKQWIHRKK